MRRIFLVGVATLALLGCAQEDAVNSANKNGNNTTNATSGDRTTVNRPSLDTATPGTSPTAPAAGSGNTGTVPGSAPGTSEVPPSTSAGTGLNQATGSPGTANPSRTTPGAASQNPGSPGSSPSTSTSGASSSQPPPPDNTAVNEQDRNADKPVPTDQGNDQKSIDTTAEIRRQILDLDDLSINARNVKVITKDGTVTLRGPVDSDEERQTVERIARNVAGADNVKSELKVLEKDK